MILRYIYGGRLSLEEYDASEIIKILIAAKKCLVSLIQHDNLQMNAIQVWENVLKWVIAQNPGLSSDPSSYSKDDFNSLKNTLQQFIPFIKFDDLTPNEFVDKVYPYKKIIPKDFREKLIKDFIIQPNNKLESKIITKEISPKSIDSRIITIQHVELITKWIDRLEITDKMKNSYEFKLILRGTRDGFSAHKFHEICDNQSHTVTIIKAKKSDEIFGGYNPIIWKSDNRFGTTKDSFIFSFKNKENISDYILSRIKEDMIHCAIDNKPNKGPSFYNDLFLYDPNCGYTWPSLYDKPIRETNGYFPIEEYEIFKVMKS
ncbi:carbohydrate-binding module family 13 protein [Rhizophagus clarus]|uniref:Carbohydrate-binding module family 13 protein n=1 Tax=Rhizophagus clarus TaxID=94130 RepID=A0A8H3MEE8_9GLOM|nr:carbohydrate-binding module family 13 protein [Rhizophagus clarus]